MYYLLLRYFINYPISSQKVDMMVFEMYPENYMFRFIDWRHFHALETFAISRTVDRLKFAKTL